MYHRHSDEGGVGDERVDQGAERQPGVEGAVEVCHAHPARPAPLLRRGIGFVKRLRGIGLVKQLTQRGAEGGGCVKRLIQREEGLQSGPGVEGPVEV